MNDVTMDLVNDRLELRARYVDHERCKLVPGLRWTPDTTAWTGPYAWATCVAARGIFGDRLEVLPALAARAWETVESIERSTRLHELIEPPALADAYVDQAAAIRSHHGHKLMPFQVVGAAWTALTGLLFTGDGLIDEMGLGKTVQAIVAARLLGCQRVLVVCPKNMKRTWCREVDEWWRGTSTHEVTGSAANRRRIIQDGHGWPDVWGTPSVTVVNWEAMRIHSRLAPYGSIALTDAERQDKELNVPWDLMIADEGHRLKDPHSKQTRAVWAVGALAERRFTLTGTPLANHLGDLWSVLRFLVPSEAPSKTRFIDRYALTTFGAWGGLEIAGIQPGREAEFRQVYDHLLRRVPKKIVLPQLPPLVTQRRGLEMESKQSKLYRRMEEDSFAVDENGRTMLAVNPAVQTTRLMQFASSYCEVSDDGDVTPVTPSNKVEALLEFIDDELGDRSVVVFAHHRKLVELAGAALEKAKISHGYIVGGQSENERQDAIDAFQAGRIQVILCTIAAGGVGITLTKASVCVFLQRSFSLVDNLQAEGRVHRIGSERHDSVLIVDFYSTGTVDEIALAVRDGKESILQEIARDRERFEAACRAISDPDSAEVEHDPELEWKQEA